MTIITNFQAPKNIEDLIERFDKGRMTNIDHLFADNGKETVWTVSKDVKRGDIVLFLCAKTSVNHMGHVRQQAKDMKNSEIIAFAENEYQKYKKYAGSIMAIGTIAEKPFQTNTSGYENAGWSSTWYAKIYKLNILREPIKMDELKDFITINSFGAITKLKDVQWNKLEKIIQKRNPALFEINREDIRLEKEVDINTPLKPTKVELINGSFITTCNSCGQTFIKAPRCPICGQLQKYEE